MERQRERERDRQTDRTDRQTDKQIDRHTNEEMIKIYSHRESITATFLAPEKIKYAGHVITPRNHVA